MKAFFGCNLVWKPSGLPRLFLVGSLFPVGMKEVHLVHMERNNVALSQVPLTPCIACQSAIVMQVLLEEQKTSMGFVAHQDPGIVIASPGSICSWVCFLTCRTLMFDGFVNLRYITALGNLDLVVQPWWVYITFTSHCCEGRQWECPKVWASSGVRNFVMCVRVRSETWPCVIVKARVMDGCGRTRSQLLLERAWSNRASYCPCSG